VIGLAGPAEAEAAGDHTEHKGSCPVNTISLLWKVDAKLIVPACLGLASLSLPAGEGQDARRLSGGVGEVTSAS
jgi:hypothetical protein